MFLLEKHIPVCHLKRNQVNVCILCNRCDYTNGRSNMFITSTHGAMNVFSEQFIFINVTEFDLEHL